MASTRKTALLMILMVIAMGGCGRDQSTIAKKEITGPGGVKIGMTRPEVIQVMLDDVQLLQMSGQVTNPYATRFVEDRDGKTLEVMYYYTGMKRGDDKVTEDELVPIILAEDAVIGWGWETLEEMTGTRLSP